MNLATATELYQVLLEQYRANPDNEHIAEDLARGRKEMETLWLESTYGK